MSKSMKVIYVAGPFRGPNAWEVEKNIRRAEELAFEVNSLGGCIALCPHTNTRFFNGTLTDEFWLEGTKELLRRCDAAMFTPDWKRSSGARDELKLARDIGTPCFTDLFALGQWLRGEHDLFTRIEGEEGDWSVPSVNLNQLRGVRS